MSDQGYVRPRVPQNSKLYMVLIHNIALLPLQLPELVDTSLLVNDPWSSGWWFLPKSLPSPSFPLHTKPDLHILATCFPLKQRKHSLFLLVISQRSVLFRDLNLPHPYMSCPSTPCNQHPLATVLLLALMVLLANWTLISYNVLYSNVLVLHSTY